MDSTGANYPFTPPTRTGLLTDQIKYAAAAQVLHNYPQLRAENITPIVASDEGTVAAAKHSDLLANVFDVILSLTWK